MDFNEMVTQLDKVAEAAQHIKPAPVLFYPYLKRVLKKDLEETELKFPMDIKIPKSNKYLLQQDFSPEYIIHLEEPVKMSDGTPMWLNTSEKQVYYRLGYDNLDARRICEAKIDMEFIHTFLGGSSGHGKSVTLNAIMGAMCYEYAPWELELHLSDAKIIEFKKYGVSHRIPHISTIAATSDPDFVISVLEKADQEMVERGKIFGNIGASNLKNFRKKTGLAYPRVLIIMDEVESTFRLAGRQSAKLGQIIDDFARLGRAAGYHLFMATQNMSSDIPSSAVGQIRNRMCLGANQKTSEAVLGNAGATDNVGRVGRLILNTNVLNGGDTTPYNIKYQTPFIDDPEVPIEMEELETKGREVGYQKVMSFYDEDDMSLYTDFDKKVEAAYSRMRSNGEVTETHVPVCLGYPAFVTEDLDAMLKIWLEFKDIENIVISSSIAEHVASHLHNIVQSLSNVGYAFRMFTTDLDLGEFLPSSVKIIESRTADKPPLSTISGLVRKRMFLMQLDQRAQSASYKREAVEKLFADCKVPKESWGNELLAKRATAYSFFRNDAALSKEWEDTLRMFPDFLALYKEYAKMNCLVKKVGFEDFQKAVFIIGDLSKIVGYGRDTKSKPVTVLKKAMQDACRVGVLFVLYTRSMDGLNELSSGLRYAIFDSPDARDYTRLRTEPPATLGGRLALLFDNINSEYPHRKFKRTLLHEEL